MKLRPEMHATVTIRYEDGGQMATVPAGSVIFDKSKHYVMVFRSRTDIETREVARTQSPGRCCLYPGRA